MAYTKYAWIGNKITSEQMAALVVVREQSRKPLALLVKEAVGEYLKKQQPGVKCGM